MPLPPAPSPPASLVPRWLSWSVVVGSLGLAAALIPSQRQLVGRLLEDGETRRAMEVAQGGGDHHLAPDLPMSPMDQLRASLTPNYLGPGAVATLAIGNAADPIACLDLVNRMEANLPPDRKLPLYVAIARSAFSRNDPALAAHVAEDAIRHGATDSSMRLIAVQAWRWAGKPENALTVFDSWRAMDPVSLTPAAQDLEIGLCRELGANDRALDILLSRIAASGPPGTAPPETINQALTVAANAGKTAALLPHLSAWIMARPAGAASWEDLASGKVAADDSFRQLAGILARHSEWTGQPSTALDCYLKLALLGDAYALERAADLQKGLCRSSDWMRLLQKVVPVPDQPQYTRQLARLLAESGLYDQAPAIYEMWLKDHPKDTAALSELAGMYAEMPESGKALALYERVAALDPKNLEVRKEIAELRLVLKDYTGAFAFYNSLPETSHDATTLENFSLLAESLGEYPAYNRSMVMRSHRLHEPHSGDFLELARSFELIDQTDAALATLADGLRRVPKSRLLRTRLAQAWRNRGNYDEAVRLLAIPALKSDMQAMSLFIEVACLKEDYQMAYAFLGKGFEKKFGFPPDVRLDLGHIYFNNGYMTEADALYSSVPDEPSLWPLIANARFRRGDLKGAELYQKRWLGSTQVPDAPGWLLMGDILRAGGRETEAQAAYGKSLSLMEQKLDPRPVADAPDPEATPRRPATAYNPTDP